MAGDELWSDFAESGDPILYLLFKTTSTDRQDRDQPAAEPPSGLAAKCVCHCETSSQTGRGNPFPSRKIPTSVTSVTGSE